MNPKTANYLLLHCVVGHGVAVEAAALAYLCVSEPGRERSRDEEPPPGILRRLSGEAAAARLEKADVKMPPRELPVPRARPAARARPWV